MTTTASGHGWPTPLRPGRARARVWLSVVVVGLLAAACGGGSPGPATSSASTIAPGSPWLGHLTAVTLPSPVNSLDAIDCVTPLHCWAVGSTVGTAGAPNGAAVVSTTDGGATWTVETVPATVGYLSAISCSDLRHCTAVGQATQTSNGQGAIIVTTNGGATWTPATVPVGALDVTAVACQPARDCLAMATTAAGTVALVTSPSQPTWVQRGTLPAPLGGATSISCPERLDCWVTAPAEVDVDHVAGQVAVTTDGGTTWSVTAAPAGAGYLNDIVCTRGSSGKGGLPFTSTTAPVTTAPVTTTPVTTTSVAATTHPGVTSAPTTTVPPTTVPPPSTTTTTAPAGVPGAWCVTVGTSAATVTGTRTGHGVILTTVDGGARWSAQRVTPAAAALLGVSCTAEDSCVAVGSAVGLEPQAGVAVLTGPTGHPWTRSASVFAPQALTAVSCSSTSHCLMVGESISEHLAGGG